MCKTRSSQLALRPARAMEAALPDQIVVHFGLGGFLGAVVARRLVFVYM
jgi:hypothetical protein